MHDGEVALSLRQIMQVINTIDLPDKKFKDTIAKQQEIERIRSQGEEKEVSDGENWRGEIDFDD